MTVKLSVILPVYNAQDYLRETIDSVLCQTFSDFELIIINDASSDNSENIILSYEDERIVYLKNERNIQVVKTLNKGISKAKGHYIARVDADDICSKERFDIQIRYLDLNPDIAVVGANVIFINKCGKHIGKGIIQGQSNEQIQRELWRRCCLYHPTVMINKTLLGSALVYDEAYPHAEDYELWLRLSLNYKLANISAPLLEYRVHDESITQKYNDIAIESTIQALSRHCRVGFATDAEKKRYVQLLRFPKNISKHADYLFVLDHFIASYELDIRSISDKAIQKKVSRNAASYLIILSCYYVKNLKKLPISAYQYYSTKVDVTLRDYFLIMRDYSVNFYRRVLYRYIAWLG